MKNKRIKRYNKVLISGNFIMRKISNPTRGEKEADGITPGGDRANGYAWAMAESNNYIYIGSNRNIIYSIISETAQDKKLADLITNIVFRGDVSTEGNDGAAEIFRYDKLRKKIEFVYKSEPSPNGIPYEYGYRSAVAFKPYNESTESVYIGSYGSQYTRILKFKKNYNPASDKPEIVFVDATGSSSIRAMTTHENKLYFGVLVTDKDLKVMESAAPSQNTWNTVADLRDFKNIPSVDSGSSGAGGIFDLISYNGYLYAFIGSGSKPLEESGFLVFKGKYIGMRASEANDYGWKWEMIVGPGAKYEPGMEVPSYAIATPFKYRACDGREYVYVGTLSNVIQSAQKALSFDYSYLYNNFMKPAQFYRFDKNDNWEMVVGTPSKDEPFEDRLSDYKAGFVHEKYKRNYSSNQYIWRMAEYNGKLFVGTFDSASLYDYLVPRKLTDIIDDLDETLKLILEYLILSSNATKPEVESLFALFNDNDYCDKSNCANDSEISLSYACSHCYDKKPSVYLSEAMNNLDINYNLDILKPLKHFLCKDLCCEIDKLIENTNYVKCRNCLNMNVLLSLNNISEKVSMRNVSSDDEYLELIYDKLNECYGDSTVEDIKETISKYNNNKKQLRYLIAKIKDYLNSPEVLKQIYYMKELRRMIDNSKIGFDFYVSEDGVDFHKISRTGFRDKFNFGIRTFVSSDDGLYIGTANPFYGAQLWKLNELAEFDC